MKPARFEAQGLTGYAVCIHHLTDRSPMTLTKRQIAEDVSKIGFTQQGSRVVLETLIEIIKRTLENGEDILIRGFGKFCVRQNRFNGRRGFGGAALSVEDRMVVFRFSPCFLQKINNGVGEDRPQ
jgi:integration host factor subunit alpha